MRPLVALLGSLLLVAGGCSSDEDSPETPEPSSAQSSEAVSSPAPDATPDGEPDHALQLRVVRASDLTDVSRSDPGDLGEDFASLDCAAFDPVPLDPDEPAVTCDPNDVRYALEPAAVQATPTEVIAQRDTSGNALVNLTFSEEAAGEIETLTTELAAADGQLAIVLDGFALATPVVTSPIVGGVIQISGAYSDAELAELEAALRGEGGSTPVASGTLQIREVRASDIDPAADAGDLTDDLAALDCDTFEPTPLDPAEPAVLCTAADAEVPPIRYALEPAVIDTTPVEVSVGVPQGQEALSVSVQLDVAATDRFANLTRRLAGTDVAFAVVVDGEALTVPTTDGAITNGLLEISGGFTEAEANALRQDLLGVG